MRGLSRLEANAKAVGPLENNVGLQLKVLLGATGVHLEIAHDRRQQNFQLEHGVLAADAAPRPRAKRYKAVVVPVLSALRQKVVRIEDVWMLVNVLLAVHLEGADDDGGAGRYGERLRGQPHVFAHLARNHRHRRVHAQRFEYDALQVVHLRGVEECGRSLCVAEYLLLLQENAFLDVLVAGQQAQHKTGAGRRRVVAFEHDGVHLLFDFGVADVDAAVRRLQHQVQEGEPILFADGRLFGVVVYAALVVAVVVHQFDVERLLHAAVLERFGQLLFFAAQHLFGQTVYGVDELVVLLFDAQQAEQYVGPQVEGAVPLVQYFAQPTRNMGGKQAERMTMRLFGWAE